MKLSREKIQRMVEDSIGGGAAGGGSSSDFLAGYATRNWVEMNFLSLETGGRVNGPVYINDKLDVFGIITAEGGRKVATQEWVERTFVKIEWFDKIFQVFNDTTKISVNGTIPTDTSQMNIKAMFGFWTDFYVSALGNGGHAGNAIYMSQLADVAFTSIQDGQVLKYSNGKWRNANETAGTVTSIKVGTTTYTPTAGVVSLPAFITASALTGYATQQWVNTQISGMATQTWVSQNYAAKALEDYFDSNGNAKSALKLTTVSKTLWGLTYWTSGGVPDNVTGTANMQQGLKIGNFYFECNSSGSYDSGRNNELNNYSGLIHFQYNSAKNLSMCYGGGSVGIGTTNPSYKLHVDGVIYASTGVYSSGYVSALSDMRCKDVASYFQLDIAAIAAAPLFRYTWNDCHDGRQMHVGSSAQYWEGFLPEAVTDINGRLTMDYGVIALTSVISVASRMMKLEARIEELEKIIKGV